MGGIDYAVSKALHYSDLARADLAKLPETDSKEALLEFVEFVMERES